MTSLPKVEFSAKFPIGLHLTLQLLIKKFKTSLNQMCNITLTKKYVRVQPCSLFEIIFNGLYF